MTSALDCEKSGAFRHRCRQGHDICISHRAARFGLDVAMVAEACDNTDPEKEHSTRRSRAAKRDAHAAVRTMQARSASQRVVTDADGNITRFSR